MAVTITTNPDDQHGNALYLKQAEVTAHAAAALLNNFQQSDAAQRLKISQDELVLACLNSGRLSAASIISTCSIPTDSVGAQITAANAVIAANPLLATSLGAQIAAWQIQQVTTAIASGTVTSAKILATMS
jgi:hypothetical protein